MRILVILFAVVMPVVAWLSNTGTFGPDNGAVSDHYPTLLVAAGYAFAIWGLIFLLDLVYAFWQSRRVLRGDPTLRKIAPWAAGGFALTTVWEGINLPNLREHISTVRPRADILVRKSRDHRLHLIRPA